MMSGTLIIAGGGLRESAEEVFSRFIESAGGASSRFAFIVLASGEGPDDCFRSYRDDMAALGVPEDHCVLVPLYAEGVADERGVNLGDGDADGLMEYLEAVRGVWFTGGDQYHIARALLRENGEDTLFLHSLRELLKQGGVIGGSSAGAAIMSRVMIAEGSNRGLLSGGLCFGYEDYQEEEDETNLCRPLRIARGLGFFEAGVVDQHFNKRPRMLRLMEAVFQESVERRLGFAVSEDTAILLRDGRLEVLGSASVYLFDGRTASRLSAGNYRNFYLSALQKGDRYELKNQEPLLAGEDSPESVSGSGLDYLNGLLCGYAHFNERIYRELLQCREGLYLDEESGESYIKGAIVHEGTERSYLILPRYYKSGETRAYQGRELSFSRIRLDVRSLEFCEGELLGAV